MLEAGDAVGGLVRTDVVDGTLLDRGFQVPARADAGRADGARADRVAQGQGAHRPARGRGGAAPGRCAAVPAGDDDVRRAAGARVSDTAVERFFRPFLSGVLLEDELSTSSRFFDLVWRSFARGTRCVTARSIQALPEQLAVGLDVRLQTPVERVRPNAVQVADGAVPARAVVVATAAPHGEAAGQGWTSDRAAASSPATPRNVLSTSTCRASTAWMNRFRKPVRLEPGLYVGGDHRDSASIKGALVSRWHAATALLAELSGHR